MSWMPEPEPTPLRLRLGPRSEVPLPPAFEDAVSFDVAEALHAQVMTELVEFEHQLGERLREQEERLAKWWDEAEQLTKQRFAEFALPASPAKDDSQKA